MIPRFIRERLARAEGPVGWHYAAYKKYRWGEPDIRVLGSLCRMSRLSIDVGANNGLYTYFIRFASKHCLAIEPNPVLAADLRRRLRLRATILEAAASDHEGHAVLRVPISGHGLATIEKDNPVPGDHQVEVKLLRLDSVVTEKVGFMKIDVEGHEMSVIRGAERLIESSRPNIMAELEERHRPGVLKDVSGYLRERGYHCWFIHGRTIRSLDEFDPVTHQTYGVSRPYVSNFVFSPDRRIEEVMQRRLG